MRICELVDGPVSAEVVSDDAEAMVEEGRALRSLHEHVTVKVPFSAAGLRATRALTDEGIPVNMTLVFSPNQALTSRVASPAPRRSREEDPVRPRSPYAASKAGGDLMVGAYHVTYGLPTLITRGALRSRRITPVSARAPAAAPMASPSGNPIQYGMCHCVMAIPKNAAANAPISPCAKFTMRFVR